jgi:dTDP-4-amino-4,6-dideoxygalactose transaminase
VSIPVLDLKRRMQRVAPELHATLERVSGSGQLLLGRELESFEQEWAAYVDRAHAVGTASGADALRIALRSIGVGERPDDEVIVPAFTSMATLGAICAAGAVPVPVDVDPATAAIDAEAAAAAVTDRTRALVPVHLYGRPAPLPELGLPTIEDAAQAHGALTGPRSTLAAIYSFYPTKNLGGIGDGGAIVTDDPELAQRARSLRDLGRDSQRRFVAIASSSRMSELEAAALRALLPLLDDDNRRRREIALRYRTAAPRLRWVEDHPDHVYHLCVARERERLASGQPFSTALHYARASTQEPAFAAFTRAPCPHAEEWARSCITLPCFPEMTEAEVATVAGRLAELEVR